MKLKTKQPINFDTWIEQIKKFTSGNTNIISTNFPVNTTDMGVAEICITMDKPLHEGFSGTICYIQHYSETKPGLKEVYTEEGGDVEMQDVTTHYTQDVITYKREMSYEDTNALVVVMESNLPSELVGLDRLKEIVIQGVLADAVGHNTFGGLLAEDYEVILE